MHPPDTIPDETRPPPKPGRLFGAGRWFALTLLVLMVALAGMAALVRFGPLTETGRALIERSVNGLAVGRLGRLDIAGLGGDVWRRFTLRRLRIVDARGVWLDAHDLALRWDAGALLGRRVHLISLSAALVTVARRPELSAETKPGPSPVSVDLDEARARVELAPALAARRGLYDVEVGAFTVERAGGARGRVTAASVLHPGDHLQARFDLGRGQSFTLRAEAVEARGGALAGLLGLAADKPFLLTADARGTATAGHFDVATRVGEALPLDAHGAWTAHGGSAQGKIDLAASSLLARWQAMIGPTATFALTGTRAADGAFALALQAASQNVGLSAKGEADIGRRLIGPRGLAVTARIADPNRIVAAPKMGPASLTGVLAGDLGGAGGGWAFSGSAAVDRPAFGGYGLARLSGPIRVRQKGGETAVELTAGGEGGAGRGLAAALLGARPTVTAEVARLADGRLLVRRFGLLGAGLKVQAAGERTLFGALTFKGDAAVSNLAAAWPGARGLVAARWSASQGGGDRPWSFAFDAVGTGLATGAAEADRLLGRAPRLKVQARWAAGAVSVERAALTGAAGDVGASGLVGPGEAVRLKLDWRATGPLDIGPLEIDGAANGSGALTGTLSRPRADFLADVASVNLPVLPLHRAHLVVSFLKGPTDIDGRFSLAAESDQGPARAAAAFRFAPGGLDLTGVDVDAGGVTAKGAVSLVTQGPSSADLTVSVRPGAILSEGRASGRVRISGARGQASASLDIEASDAVLASGGAAIKTLKLTADGPLDRLPYRASAEGVLGLAPWRLAGSGVFTQSRGAETSVARGLTFAGAGRLRRIDVRTLTPARFTLAEGAAGARLSLGVGSGRADIDLTSRDGAMTAKAAVADLQLALLDESFIGRLDGTFDAAGAGPRLTGEADLKLTGAGGRDLQGTPPVDGVIKARLTSGSIQAQANFVNSRGFKASADFTLPAEASAAPFHIALERQRPMKGDFSVTGELKPLWDLAMGEDRSLSGRVAASGTVSGTLADPRAVGTAALDDGRFQDAGTGLKVDGLTLRATLANNAVDISRFSGTDGAKGAVSGSGRVSLARAGASDFLLNLDRFQLIDNDLAQAVASGRIAVNRAADGAVKLSGALAVERAQIAPNPPVANGVVPMEVTEIHKPAGDDAASTAAPPRAVNVALDVGLKAPGGVFVKGRGLNLELSLDAHVGGTTARPVLSGVARVVRGDYNFAGQRFQLADRGVVTLGSTAETIRLDLTATRDNPTLTAVIRIQGTAAKPTITLTSTPVLPQDEVLSQVLFGASASQLNALQAAQLASAVAGLAGGGGFDVIGGLRNFAHLDRLAISTSTVTGTTVAGGKYLRDNLYLELTGGGREGPGVQVEWRVRKHVSIVSATTSQGYSQLSVRWRKDY